MTDPVTAAGRALLDHEMGDRDVPGNDLYLSADEVRAAIIAIEQESAALARAEAGVEAAIRTALEGTYYANVPWDAAMLDRVAERFAAALADQERGS